MLQVVACCSSSGPGCALTVIQRTSALAFLALIMFVFYFERIDYENVKVEFY